MKKLALVAGAVALLGAGVWLGHSSSQPAAAERPQRSARIAPTVTRSMPVLPSKPVDLSLEKDLRDPDPRVRRAAIRETDDTQVLLAASRDRDREVALAATEALGKLHAQGQLPAEELVARVLDHSIDERVRVSAINGLGVVPSPEAAKALADMLARGDMLEKRSAAILLSHQDLSIAVPALIDALSDADEVVRANALESLRGRARGRDFGSDAGAWRAWWAARSR